MLELDDGPISGNKVMIVCCPPAAHAVSTAIFLAKSVGTIFRLAVIAAVPGGIPDSYEAKRRTFELNIPDRGWLPSVLLARILPVFGRFLFFAIAHGQKT